MLDSFILIISVIEMGLVPTGWTLNARAFRLLRVIKPLMSLHLFSGGRHIVLGLVRAWPQYVVCAALVVIVSLTFAVGLITPFAGEFGRRCVVAGRDTVYVMDTFDNPKRIVRVVPEMFCTMPSNATRSVHTIHV